MFYTHTHVKIWSLGWMCKGLMFVMAQEYVKVRIRMEERKRGRVEVLGCRWG